MNTTVHILLYIMVMFIHFKNQLLSLESEALVPELKFTQGLMSFTQQLATKTQECVSGLEDSKPLFTDKL